MINYNDAEKALEYLKSTDELNKKHAVRDAEGTIEYISVTGNNGRPMQAYKKIVGEGKEGSDYELDLVKLRKKYKETLDQADEKQKAYREHLNNIVPENDLKLLMIDLDIVPNGLHPKAMDGCIHFIKDDVSI